MRGAGGGERARGTQGTTRAKLGYGLEDATGDSRSDAKTEAKSLALRLPLRALQPTAECERLWYGTALCASLSFDLCATVGAL